MGSVSESGEVQIARELTHDLHTLTCDACPLKVLINRNEAMNSLCVE